MKTRPESPHIPFSWPRFLAWFLFGTGFAGIPISLFTWLYVLLDSEWAHAAFVLPLAFGILASEASRMGGKRCRRSLLGVVFVVGIIGWAGLGFQFWQFSLRSQQVQNLSLMRGYGSAVEEYKEIHGEYPDVLPVVSFGRNAPGEDWWGNPIQYETKDDAYVVISPGKGGEIETNDPWVLRHQFQEDRQFINICGKWQADFVLTDVGFVQGCGK